MLRYVDTRARSVAGVDSILLEHQRVSDFYLKLGKEVILILIS